VAVAACLAVALAGRASAQDTAAWQAELNAAKAKRSRGLHVEIAGLVVTGAGVALALQCVGECDATTAWTGLVLMPAGGAIGGFGHIMARDASSEVKWLTSHGAAPMAASQWQREMDAAKDKRASGRKVLLIGLGILGSGFGVDAATTHCWHTTCQSARPIGYGLTLLGALTVAAGNGQAHDAGLTMKLLNRHPPAGAGSGAPSSGVSQSLRVSLGPVTRVNYTVEWR